MAPSRSSATTTTTPSSPSATTSETRSSAARAPGSGLRGFRRRTHRRRGRRHSVLITTTTDRLPRSARRRARGNRLSYGRPRGRSPSRASPSAVTRLTKEESRPESVTMASRSSAMPKFKEGQLPSYHLHKQSGQCCENGIFRFRQASSAALPHAGRYANLSVRRDLSRVGDTGLEPVTSSVSCWRASQLRQSPESEAARIIAEVLTVTSRGAGAGWIFGGVGRPV